MGSSSFLAVVVLVLSCCFRSVLSLELVPYSLPGRLYPLAKYVTVSGTGKGGIFAQMMHFSHSKYISGCAVYSSTYYRCGPANGNREEFTAMCTKGPPFPPEEKYQVSQAVTELQSNDATHVIDPLSHMRYSRLYVYCGLQNHEFRSSQQLNVVALYERYLASPYAIYTRVQDTDVELRVINPNQPYSATCPKTAQADATVSPNCTSMSAPAEALGFLLKDTYLKYSNPFYPRLRYVRLEPLRSFNQSEFTTDLEYPGLDDIGYYYIPRYCQQRSHSYRKNYGHHPSYSKPCLVHVYFHGCKQGREFMGTSHVLSSNYLEIAEENYIIMLFPQALSSEANPEGCFDYVGFTGVLYATKSGPQIEAVWRMLERLLYLTPEKTTSTYYRAGSGGDSKYPANDQQQQTNYGPSYNNNYNSNNKKYVSSSSSNSGNSRPPLPPYYRR